MYTGFTKDAIWMNTKVSSVTSKPGLDINFWVRNFICAPDRARKKTGAKSISMRKSN